MTVCEFAPQAQLVKACSKNHLEIATCEQYDKVV